MTHVKLKAFTGLKNGISSNYQQAFVNLLRLRYFEIKSCSNFRFFLLFKSIQKAEQISRDRVEVSTFIYSKIMHWKKIHVFTISIFLVINFGCGPKEVNTDPEELSNASESWIPFEGTESVTFSHDTATMVFSGTGKTSFFETVRYKTDQGGLFTFQEDYYADLERQNLEFVSPSTDFFFKYYLEKNKGETGMWDILKVTISEGIYYSNEMKIVISETDDFDKGDNFSFKESLTLNGVTYSDVYFWKQERRPFELYYTQFQGIIGFKLSSNELWTIQN